ncbi:ATP-dependent acyl-CoA ligase [Bacillus sp. AFS018417]|uniref:ATP-dependent acyl-CoA ligase n=1 Tax=Bacillus sp. AFS018417 TaxID=2033491 RepID=UPI000BF48437|nr:ATP-dependent acyl-CoA ligase [Bacillus sp. AFS018417]PEZ09189.1 ATP-dependent acyl-CoA ligase [Bacillus sp. AFS018417]
MMENYSLPHFIMRSIEKTPNKVYLQFEEQRVTYEDLYHRITRAAAGFRELGIQKGDKVCIMLHNAPEYLDVWFSLSFMGAIAVPLNVHLKGEGLQYILSHSDCKLIIVDQDFVSQIASCLPFIQREIQVVVYGNNESVIMMGNGEERPVIGLKDVLNTNYHHFPNEAVSSSSINSILYTSGTTGLPKGVMLSHSAYVNSAQSFADHMVGANSKDILFTALPLFHINAQAHTVFGAIHSNATVALGKRFSASRFWDEIRYHGATIFNSLGSMIPILCKQPEKENDHENPARVTACAATPKEFWKMFEERFGVRIVEGYGLTETTGFCVTNPLNANKPPSIGKPYSYVETKIVNEEGNEAPIGEIGEIYIHSSQAVMEGYYKMPDKTEEALEGGWFHTGDRGYRDEEGYLYFCDRIKQCIRRRGENISSWEIEKVVNNHPKVLESAAIGVPSEVGEEDVKLYVILKQGEMMSHEEIIDWCQERMAYFMVPRYVQFSESFPKTATERIQKFKLKEEGIGAAWDREQAGYVITRTS